MKATVVAIQMDQYHIVVPQAAGLVVARHRRRHRPVKKNKENGNL